MVRIVLHMFSAPMDEEGIIPDALEKSIEANMSSRPAVGSLHPFWAMVYLIPTFHNPTGVCLSPGRICAYCITSTVSSFHY